MKISVYESDQQSQEHILAEDGQETYSGLTLTPESEMQVKRFMRAENAAPEDRGNQMLSLEFTVARQHASISAASQYSLEIAATVPREGLVKFERLDGEVVAFKRFFQLGIVRLVGIVPFGVRTDLTWRIIGGNLLTEAELT